MRHYLRLWVTRNRKALTRLLFSDHLLALEQLRQADRYHPFVPRDKRLCCLCASSVESPEHAVLLCEGDPDLVSIRSAALTLLMPKLPHLNLSCPIPPEQALDTLRGMICQDICLPPVAKLVYGVMELFKGFELERPRYDKPLPVLRTCHRRIPGCPPARTQPATHMYLFLPKTRTDGLLLPFVQAFFDGIINGIGHVRLQLDGPQMIAYWIHVGCALIFFMINGREWESVLLPERGE